VSELGALDRGYYTEVSPPKIPFWGVIRTNWLPNHPNGVLDGIFFT
jgi:hypothetical protein